MGLSGLETEQPRAGTQQTTDDLAALIAAQKPGFSLEQPFYSDPAIYARDIERIFLRDWLYAGHVSQIPAAGDFFLFDIATESVIVVRGQDGEIRALVNVCRHRGSRVCLERHGTAKSFVCPYHAWTYDLAGRLTASRLMPADFEATGYGLKQIHLRVLRGFIFVNFADTPSDFDAVEQALSDHLAPFGFERAKVAHSGAYPIESNWKLAVENYVECYHCAPAHPEFAKSHSIKFPRERIAKLTDAMLCRAKEVGLDGACVDRTGTAAGPDGVQIYFDRYALFDGYLTGSEDGQPLAPLMGDIKDFDGGASNIQVGPLTYFLAYCDHVVVYRFTPRDIQKTDCEIVWLVDQNAVEGKDYDLERLTWLWHVTTEADKRIIENNQKGVNSRFFAPGPLAPMESHCRDFVAWYLQTIA